MSKNSLPVQLVTSCNVSLQHAKFVILLIIVIQQQRRQPFTGSYLGQLGGASTRTLRNINPI